jgi:hypothetical protein
MWIRIRRWDGWCGLEEDGYYTLFAAFVEFGKLETGQEKWFVAQICAHMNERDFRTSKEEWTPGLVLRTQKCMLCSSCFCIKRLYFKWCDLILFYCLVSSFSPNAI